MMTPRMPTPTHYPTPNGKGFFWAKWRVASEGTADSDELTPSDRWEVVHVFENGLEQDEPEFLMAFVLGVDQVQALENFIWGPGPLTPPGSPT